MDVGFATDADLAGRDLEGKAVFFNSADYQSRHSTISHGAVKRIGDKGAAAIFITLAPSLQLIDNPVPLEDLRRR